MTDSEGRAWRLVEPEDPQYVESGACVTDRDSGVTYRATIHRNGRNPYLTSLQIDAPEGVRIDARFLATVPADRIAGAVAQYLDASAQAPADSLVILPPEAVRGRGAMPDLAELAARYREPGTGGRKAVVADYMSEYDVSRATVDRWIAQARQAGLIPKASTGRPPTTTTTTTTATATAKGRRKS